MSTDLTGKIRKQTATVWVKSAPDGFNKPGFGSPRTILVRWADQAVQFIAPDRKEALSRSVVFVGEDLALGDYLALGDQTGTANPLSLTNSAWAIQQFDKIPSRKGTKFVRKALL